MLRVKRRPIVAKSRPIFATLVTAPNKVVSASKCHTFIFLIIIIIFTIIVFY